MRKSNMPKVTRRYNILSLDVWGNKKDGFEVNDLYQTNYFIELSGVFDAKDVLKALRKSGYISSYSGLKVDDGNDWEYGIYIKTKSGEPFCNLEPAYD